MVLTSLNGGLGVRERDFQHHCTRPYYSLAPVCSADDTMAMFPDHAQMLEFSLVGECI